MITAFTMILMLGAGFLAVALSFAAKEEVRLRLIAIAGSIAFASGIILYGYGYAACYGISVVSVLRALLALCRMLTGGNDLNSIQAAPLLQNSAVVAVFWIGHFCAYYVTAGAVMMRFGEGLLYSIRVRRFRSGPLLLIYGVNANSLTYGSRMIQEGKYAVCFTDKNCSAEDEKSIRAMGAVLEREESTGRLNLFLRRIGMKRHKRQMLAAALQADGKRNFAWASALRDALFELGVEPEQTALMLCGAEERAAELQEKDGKGYGSVYAFDSYDLSVRALLSAVPPWKMVPFDEEGRAEMDFRCAIIGFGRMGRAMLSHLLMNAQFAGSRFTADVFDPGAENGMLFESEKLTDYDVVFHEKSGQSRELYALLREQDEKILCIAICTGSSAQDEEIAEDLMEWYQRRGTMPVLFLASKERAAVYGPDRTLRELGSAYENIVVPDIWQIDAEAIRLNAMYNGAKGEGEIRAAWKNCDYFSRMSNRAAVDFLPAYLHMSGRTREQVLSGDWPPAAGVVENLAETEHLRWCAFHRVFGYRRMSDEEFEKRLEQYRKEIDETGHSSLRIAKNAEDRKHACLIPWDKLDGLSARENAVTGEGKDYKQYDRDNVIALPQVLRALSGGEGKDEDGIRL